MNRLILIGNGFDLAHGLKTSYKDFIFWYLDRCFDNAGIYTNSEPYEDRFLRITVLEHDTLMKLGLVSREKGLSRYLYEKGLLGQYLNFIEEGILDGGEIRASYTEVSKLLAHTTEFKSRFFKRLIDSCLECGWVDIENQYFDDLLELGGMFKVKSFDLDSVQDLNREFEYLKIKLEEYLTLEEKRHTIASNKSFLDILNAKFEISDFDTVVDYESLRKNLGYDHTIEKEIRHQAYMLNFNYTNTLFPYLKDMEGKYFTRVELNHIHGQLNDPGNPIIFGFGDEHDKEYLQFEEQRMDELFDHIKSYQYFRTPNYRKLIRFLNEDHYQVFVMGHSCGLSDRTMFKEIFDHDNCRSIKIFHHKRQDGSTDFHEKTIHIGRHFSDKGRMRKLMVEFNEADALPQK